MSVIIDKRLRKKSSLNPVCIQYCYSSKQRTLLQTEIAIPLTYWDEKKGAISNTLPEQFGITADLNKRLDKMVRIVNQLIDQAEEHDANPLEYVRDIFRRI